MKKTVMLALVTTFALQDASAQSQRREAPREHEELLVIRKKGKAPHALRAEAA